MTLSDNKHLSFGRYLQACRKNKNLSLDFIARELKIGAVVLLAIENENLSMMPDEVFAKGFLKGFAKTVGADEERVISDYLKQLHRHDRSIQPGHDPVKENDSFWIKLMLPVVVVFFVICLTVFFHPEPEERVPEVQDAGPVVSDSLPDANSVNPDDNAGNASSPEAVPDKICLSVITIAKTWIKIIIDNEKVKEYTLQPGDRLNFEASNKYNLLIGNAAGIKLFANRIPIELPEEEGKVVNIEIP